MKRIIEQLTKNLQLAESFSQDDIKRIEKFNCNGKSPKESAKLAIKFIDFVISQKDGSYFNTRIWDNFWENGDDVSEAVANAIVNKANKDKDFKDYVANIYKDAMPKRLVLDAFALTENKDNKMTIKWSYKNPDQHSPADKIHRKLTITKEQGTFSWDEDDNLEHGKGFKSAIDAYEDALKTLEEYDDFEINKTSKDVKEFFGKNELKESTTSHWEQRVDGLVQAGKNLHAIFDAEKFEPHAVVEAFVYENKDAKAKEYPYGYEVKLVTASYGKEDVVDGYERDLQTAIQECLNGVKYLDNKYELDIFNDYKPIAPSEDDVKFMSDSSLSESKLNEGSKNLFYGIPDVEYISHGDWADGEIRYNGFLYNAWDLEDGLVASYDEFVEEGGNLEYDEWVKENADEVYSTLDYLMPSEAYAVLDDNSQVIAIYGDEESAVARAVELGAEVQEDGVLNGYDVAEMKHGKWVRVNVYYDMPLDAIRDIKDSDWQKIVWGNSLKEEYSDEDIKFYNGELLYGYLNGVELAMRLEDVEAIVKCSPDDRADNITEVHQKDYIQEQLDTFSDEQLSVVVDYLDSITRDEFLNELERSDREDFVILILAEIIEDENADLF